MHQSLRHLIKEYQEPEEIIYNDKFSVGIQDLFNKHNPKSTMQIKSLLDDNGYYGRAKVQEVYTGGHRMLQCRIHINMIWSNFSYLWPYKGMYSYRDNIIYRMYQLKPVDIYMDTALDNLYNNYGRSIQDYSSKLIPKRSEMSIMSLLSETKAMTMDGFMLQNKTDIQEYKENVLNIK